jgi:hypothetical protein
MEQYNIAEHGDLMEQQAANFIQQKFPHYERVWQIYVGNIGNATIAPLPGYPDEAKRQSFAEHSYSTLVSCFMLDHILQSGIFERTINSFHDFAQLNVSFVAFFAYLGRVRDTALKAAAGLGYHHEDFRQALQPFYEARNIVIHGKEVPVRLDKEDFVIIPRLQTENIKGNNWSDKNLWGDAADMENGYMGDTCQTYFDGLLAVINDEYARFFDVIIGELNDIPAKLVFDRSQANTSRSTDVDLVLPASASYNDIAASGTTAATYRGS